MQLPSLDRLKEAASLVHQAMPPTPQFCWPLLCERLHTEVWVKHENHTPVGAFKIRGGLVYFDDLRRQHPEFKGVIAATRGNHGQSIAFAAKRCDINATVVVPHGNSREKNAAMRALGAELIEHGSDFQDAVEHARELAAERGLHMVPSFHEALVRGVASYSLELFHAVPNLDVLYVPIGLGSGICGAVAVQKALGLKTEIVGVVAESAPSIAESYAQGRPLSHAVAATVADGVAVRTPNADALELILANVARVVTVPEDDIRSAMRALFTDTHNVAEGAGAIALAAALREKAKLARRRIAIVLTGGNVDREVFSNVLAEGY